ncbi:MAG: SusC/RagA family TonB-linked outer membrane protein [Chitinophagaceae bacterium]|nr:SusC/RagA family TonB-linked outer membrane protein [Chitinophagaceae bacterium]
MRLLSLFLFVFLFKVNAGGYAQTIKLKVTNVALTEVFQQIKQQTDFRFIYLRDDLQKAKPVSIDVQEASIKDVLDICFAQQPFTYVVQGKYIIIKKKAVVDNVIAEPAAAGYDISGYVVDEEGEPAAGITVQVKGSQLAASSNAQGYFQLKGIEPDAVLVFSGVNVEEKSVAVKGAKEITVRLIRKVNKLDEVQVIAYGSTTKRLNTGSVSKISKTEIERQPVANPLATMQGRAPGVFVTTQNGLPGGNINVLIRGRGSINSGTDPLFVIDGIPFNSIPLNNSFTPLSSGITGSMSPFNSINPNDIESIEILKDADATAIYGSRGANGVVLITTKKGKAGKNKLDIQVYQGVNQLNHFPHLLSVEEYLQLRKEAFVNDNITANSSNAPDLLLWDSSKNTDWARYILGGKSAVSNAQISLSGGSNLLHYRLSGHYRNEAMILPGNQHYQRGGVNLNVQQRSADKRFGLDVSFSYSADRNESLASSVFSILSQAPNFPIYDGAGNFNWVGAPDINPAAVLHQTSKSETSNLLSQLQTDYALTKDLRIKLSLGYTYTLLGQVNKFPKASLHPLYGSESYVHYGDNKSYVIIGEPQIEYNRKFKEHHLQVLTGLTWQQSIRKGSFTTGRNYTTEELLDFIGAAGTISASNQYSEYKYASVFTRIRYDYAEKYIINLQGRRDGSSRFGPGSRFGHFGSLGAAWIFSSESYLKKRWLSFGKLRGSFGVAGNDQIPDYQYLSTYRTTGVPYQTAQGLLPSRIANADFRWETNQKLEAALELGFWNNRLLVNSSFYYNICGNQLVSYPLPYMSGPFGSYTANLPARVENKGWEFDINAYPIRKADFQWSISFNLTLPRNKLLSYPNLENTSYAYTYVVGQDINVRTGLKFLGVDVQNGLPLFEDVNKDGSISIPGDYTVIGKLSPYYYGGFGHEFRFKQFVMQLFFQYSKQFVAGAVPLAGSSNNQFHTAMKRWQRPGDITLVPKATTQTSGAYYNYLYSSAGMYNASYVRCKNLFVGYRLPAAILRKLGLHDFEVSVQAQNLFTIRKDTSLYDPETGNMSIAPMRTVTLGLRFTF